MRSALVGLAGLLSLGAGAGQARPLLPSDSTRSTRTGVYIPAQATRGFEVYALSCQSCHTPASHAGPQFAAKWRGRRLSELFDYVRTSMPKSDPGSLTRRQYILVLAYLLKMNGMPAGTAELTADSLSLSRIMIEFRPTADTTSQR